MADFNFYAKSSESMDELQSNSVALTVTSPPYWNAIDYDTFSVSKRDQNYRTLKYGNGFESEDVLGYVEYLEWSRRIFDEVYHVTKLGGFCAIVIGTILFNGRYFAAPFDLLHLLTTKSKWLFHQDIIWNKVTAGIRRAGVVIQKPYPGYYYPNIMTEHILILRKSGDPIYKGLNGERELSSYPIDDLFKRDIANNVWHIATVPPGVIDHPCPFPEEIPDRLIKLYSYKNDLILDPFLGSGQTTKVAVNLGRNTVRYDIQKTYVDLAIQRMTEPSKIRKKQLVARFDKVFPDAGKLL